VAHWHTTQVHCTAQIQNCIALFSRGTLANNVRSTVLLEFKTASLCYWVAHWHTTQVHSTAQIQNCISLFSCSTLTHDSSILYSSNSKLHFFVFGWHTGTRLKYIVILELKKIYFFLFGWHTGTIFKYIDELEFKTASLRFSVAHWHTTHVHCNARIQNYISFFSGGTLAHNSSILYSSNSKPHRIVFGCHTGTRLKSTVLLEFKTVSLCFQVAHWPTTQVYCTARIHNCISFFSKLYLCVFRWHTGTRLKYIVLPEFKTASLCFWVAHWLTTQFHCTAQIQNCISLFLGGTLAHWHMTQVHCNDQIQNCISLFLCGTLAHWHMTQVHCNAQIQNCISLFLCGTLAHWHMTQVHCNAQIQNCISLFSGGTLAHDLIPLYCSNSKLYLFVFGWHTVTQFKSTVLLEFKTVSLSFRVAQWHLFISQGS
jgi:hypothetical protein